MAKVAFKNVINFSTEKQDGRQLLYTELTEDGERSDVQNDHNDRNSGDGKNSQEKKPQTATNQSELLNSEYSYSSILELYSANPSKCWTIRRIKWSRKLAPVDNEIILSNSAIKVPHNNNNAHLFFNLQLISAGNEFRVCHFV